MEKTFEELLEDYLNFEDYSDKYDEDLLCCNTQENKKQKRVIFDRNSCIKIEEFVKYYLNIDIDAHNLYHASLRELTNGNLIGISNLFAYQNPKYIQNGYLLVVLDAKKNPGTYINPLILNQYLNIMETKTIIDKKWHKNSIFNDIKKIRKAYVELNRALCVYSLHRDFINSIDRLIEETNVKKKIKKLKIGNL